MAAEGEFPKVDGDVLYGSEANLLRPVMQVYTGSGFNSTASNSVDEQDHELTAITATQAKSAAFVKLTITGTTATGEDGETQFKAQIKETGQSYADIVSYQTIYDNTSVGPGTGRTLTTTHMLIETLTAGMKTNGFQIKVFSKSIGTGGAPIGSASFTNIQTVQELA